MDIKAKIEMNKKNIWQAVEDYKKHTREKDVLDDISEKFVSRLAKDNAYAKRELRTLFRMSPVWDESLDALVINGTRTHNPDYARVQQLAEDILFPAQQIMNLEDVELLNCAIRFFTHPKENPEPAIEAMEKIAPKAYAPRKKRSRIFHALCDALGVADNRAGSNFQRLYAQFADEISSRKIDFKLYVSLNPAHFLTMSNPKVDMRGDTLTSCHSLNSTSYSYNNGCSGYARDNYTFIAFVAAEPAISETLNNRKTARQIFAYKPGNGLLLQSRLYNTEGGTCGAQADSRLYRDLIQRELSDLEGAPNIWKTYTYVNNSKCSIGAGTGFGGYTDWLYKEFNAKLSIRIDHEENYESFNIGTYGLCIQCGEEIDKWLYCYDCNDSFYEEDEDEDRCEACGDYFSSTYLVIDSHGHETYVCAGCRDRLYAYCDECHVYYPKADVVEVAEEIRICPSCLERHYAKCPDCGKYFLKEELKDGRCVDCLAKFKENGKEVAA
ncbi:hypothetical protein [Selenomonas sp. KH1T6]|uniref:hypothetical protein n=1 Tax=Selenomonas sp. KH1T6 TaxID=3158784 RepID=UPI0008A7BFE4|nr:hypothetical protein SAMN05216583_103174 [Selenomonas ruminantium]